MVLRICSLLWLVAGLLILPAWAARPYRPNQPRLQNVTVTGTMGTVNAGGFSVVADAKGGGTTWVVFTDPNTTFHATGTALADFLRPRLTVQFAADLDDKGTGKDKVGELTIVSPTSAHVPGVFKGEGAAANVATPDAAAPKAAGKGKDKAAPAGKGWFENFGKAKVVGKVVSYKENRLIVAAGKRKVEVDLTDEPLIHVDVAEGTFASAGDKVVVKGKEVKGQQGACEAESVEITFSQPLTSPKKKLAKAKPESHHSHHVAKDDELSDDAAGEDVAKKDASKEIAAKKDAPAKDEKFGDADLKSK
jgi:hypothetical protein